MHTARCTYKVKAVGCMFEFCQSKASQQEQLRTRLSSPKAELKASQLSNASDTAQPSHQEDQSQLNDSYYHDDPTLKFITMPTSTSTTQSSSTFSRIFIPNLLGRQSITLNFLGDVEITPHHIDSTPWDATSSSSTSTSRSSSVSSSVTTTTTPPPNSRSSSFSSVREVDAGKGAVAFWSE